jgi:hypothetical protein
MQHGTLGLLQRKEVLIICRPNNNEMLGKAKGVRYPVVELYHAFTGSNSTMIDCFNTLKQ